MKLIKHVSPYATRIQLDFAGEPSLFLDYYCDGRVYHAEAHEGLKWK